MAPRLARKDKTLTNTFGKVYAPGEELGVGYGRVEDGNVKLTIQRLDASMIEGRFATVKTVDLGSVKFSFDVTFHVTSKKN